MTSTNRNYDARALSVLPGGASHDGRQLSPLTFIASHAKQGRKTDAGGQVVVDLQCGNGSLILGHGHPSVLAACESAIRAGLNFSATSEAEITWAETVRSLMPWNRKVCFTASGNEACMLAFAVARAQTERSAILTLRGHYCGWIAPTCMRHVAYRSVGEPSGAPRENTLVVCDTPGAAREALSTKQFAALILEPTGGSFGKYHLPSDELAKLAASARQSGTVCIFDETLTGFRVAPGGAQTLYNIRPDLTVLGKILGGGLPCGAIAGRDDMLALLDNRPDYQKTPRVSHMGTGNGSPLAAAAGTATLKAIADGKAGTAAEATASAIRSAFQDVLDEASVDWLVYGRHSAIHLFLNPLGRDTQEIDATSHTFEEISLKSPPLVNALRVACLRHGLDINGWPGGTVSAVHDDADIQLAAEAFAAALRDLRSASHTLTGWGR